MTTRGYFVTGTDTGVGKTFVSTRLVNRARVGGHQVFAFKPIETGCQPPMGDDQRLLNEAAGNWQVGELCGVYQLTLAAAPFVAATAAGVTISIEQIVEVYRTGCAAATFAVVEGAGGWRVPITNNVDMAGLAKRLELPVLLVARATLGTINHTLLSAEAIVRDGCELAGVILSQQPTDESALLLSNVEEISRHVPCPVVVLGKDPVVLDRFT